MFAAREFTDHVADLGSDRVIGVDPGLATTGYGVVERDPGGVKAVAYGVIKTPREMSLPDRLAMLADRLGAIVAQARPASMGVERLLFQSNAKTAISVGQASGIALLIASRSGLDVGFYSPNEVKQAVAGYGAAGKSQVSQMVARVLNLGAPPRPADAADALAIALCHINSVRFRAAIEHLGA